MVLSNAYIKSRIPWIAALSALVFIWSVWSFGAHLKPSAKFHSQESQSQKPTAQVVSNHLVPLPTAEPVPPRFPAFEDQAAHASEAGYVSERPLIMYAYFESENARRNLEFYLAHALHGAADFLFVFNGNTDAATLVPKAGNIRVVHRENRCYDLGAFAELLTENDLWKKYKRYITMNASIRGPFMPHWSDSCWSDLYLSKLTEKIKLVGISMNCIVRNHIQSMLWAFDRTTVEFLLFPSPELVEKYYQILGPYEVDPVVPVPPMTSPGINSCPHGYLDAVAIEVYATGLVQAAGYEVDAMMYAFHGRPDYQKSCQDTGDVQSAGGYYGTDMHPFDTVFAKANRGIAPLVLQTLTEWTDVTNYSSYDHCHI